ncbi:MAG TPA: hypothetical protein VGP80_15225 [Gemmatimonadales bacterium]|nr:hypothetical protein [Gemmatimonadales bacterium]
MAGNTEIVSGPRGNPWRMAIWGIAAFLLLLPRVAMQFTSDVNWTLRDFVTFGAMLLVACGTYELATRLSANTMYRAAVGVAVVGGFLLVWMTLAVGIIESEADSANLMFGGVLLVGAIGAIIARFQPRGMARALIATAIAQGLVAVIAVIGGFGGRPLWLLTPFYVAVWLVSAALFRKAARE